jgi:myo-inositol-1-phosphate synthase
MMKKNKIRVAIVGVGSFCKALVEGVSFYTKHPHEKIGLMHQSIGPYQIKDIEFSCAFDVDERKVGQKLHEAIETGPNISQQITKPCSYDAMVYLGPSLDGIIEQMKGHFIVESRQAVCDIAKILKDTQTDILINLIPSGSVEASLFYAKEALKAGCHFINCIPSPVANIESLRHEFEKQGLVLMGDDLKSQLGATMLNRIIINTFKMRGIHLSKSHQENIGGNADHFNLIHRSEHKAQSKKATLEKFLEETDATPTVAFQYTGIPSGHKTVNLFLEGEIFGKTKIVVNATIEDEISINGAGVLVDAIRMTQFLKDKNLIQDAQIACAFLFKCAPVHLNDLEAYEAFEKILKS